MIGEGPRPEPPGKREKNPEAVDRGRAGGKKGGTGGRCGAAHPTRAKGEAGMSDGVIGTLRDPSLPPKTARYPAEWTRGRPSNGRCYLTCYRLCGDPALGRSFRYVEGWVWNPAARRRSGMPGWRIPTAASSTRPRAGATPRTPPISASLHSPCRSSWSRRTRTSSRRHSPPAPTSGMRAPRWAATWAPDSSTRSGGPRGAAWLVFWLRCRYSVPTPK